MKLTTYTIIVSFLLYSCTPRIYQFDPKPHTITKDDSVFVTWKVRGKPTLIVHDKVPETSSLESNNGRIYYKEFTLVVTKNGKDSSLMKQVTVIPKESSDIIVFNTILKGDTLIAAGINNNETWNNNFQIGLIGSASNRPLIVTHANKQAKLDSMGTYSNIFEGTSVSGEWAFRSLLTTQEKNDPFLAPASLRIKVTIKYKIQ